MQKLVLMYLNSSSRERWMLLFSSLFFFLLNDTLAHDIIQSTFTINLPFSLNRLIIVSPIQLTLTMKINHHDWFSVCLYSVIITYSARLWGICVLAAWVHSLSLMGMHGELGVVVSLFYHMASSDPNLGHQV